MSRVPLVTIVTPVLNGARFIADNLASVRGQDHPRIQHIVVDGGSTDGTVEILRRAEGVLWTSEPDGGMYDAIGHGLRRAQGEIVAYQNAATIAIPDSGSPAVADPRAPRCNSSPRDSRPGGWAGPDPTLSGRLGLTALRGAG
jgi:glycosyltransferase involved in cell wall biosynthesis